MCIDKLNRILGVLMSFSGIGGVGGQNLATIVFWSKVSRSTTYRYLLKLEKLGYVDRYYDNYHGHEASMWCITPAGVDFIGGW